MIGLTQLFVGGSAGKVLVDAPPGELPEFSGSPASFEIEEGESAAFFVVVNKKGYKTTLQWRKDGVDLPGETLVTLDVWCCDANDAGVYDCVATNAAGSVTSNAGVLTVNVVVPTPVGYWGMESVRTV